MRANEGAANRQAHRPSRNAAESRGPRQSIPAWADEGEWGTAKTVAVTIAGSLFLYAFMWLAAC